MCDHGFIGPCAVCDGCGQQPEVDTLQEPTTGSWAPEVIADDSGKWAGNALRFATRAEAQAWVEGLRNRWFLVREIRVVRSSDPVNMEDGQLG